MTKELEKHITDWFVELWHRAWQVELEAYAFRFGSNKDFEEFMVDNLNIVVEQAKDLCNWQPLACAIIDEMVYTKVIGVRKKTN